MMKRLKRQVTQKHEGSMMILKEVEKMREDIYKPQEATPSILQPKISNIDNTKSSVNRRTIGSSIPASIPTWNTAPREQAHTIQDLGETFITHNN